MSGAGTTAVAKRVEVVLGGFTERHDQCRAISILEKGAAGRVVCPVNARAARVFLNATSAVLSDDIRVLFVASLRVKLGVSTGLAA